MRRLSTLCFLFCLLFPASHATAQGLSVNWAQEAGNEDGFRIERKCAPAESFSALVTLPTPDLQEYVDSTAPTGILCTYRVLAYNGDGDSAWSNESSGTALSSSSSILSPPFVRRSRLHPLAPFRPF
jgi:hypothetical protein